MIFKEKKIQKLISALMIVAMFAPSLVFFSSPKKAEAQFVDPLNAVWQPFRAVFDFINTASTVTDTVLSLKELAREIGRLFLQRLARKFLAEMTTSTINWINTGFHGKPLFLENPESFFRNIAKSEIRNFVDMVGYNRLNFPFGRQIALQAINSYKRQFEVNAQYSLSRVINDPALLASYRNNFNVGGWNGFLLNTQYPQNNYLGFQMMMNNELALRLEGTTSNIATRIQNNLQQGLGFLSQQTCLSNPEYNNNVDPYNRPAFKKPQFNAPVPRDRESREKFAQRFNAYQKKYNNLVSLERAQWEKENICPGGLVTVTPGSIAANRIMEALGTTQRQGELSAALGNNLSAIFDALVNHFMDKGLTSLATRVNPQPDLDEWSYEGQTLGVGESGVNVSWNTGPDEEIILDDFKKRISGKTIILNDAEVVIGEEIGNTGNGIYVPGDIVNTEAELKLMYNESTTEPGIMQLLNQIWPQIRELDICQPGPDFGWKKRADSERDRNSTKLQENINNTDGNKAAEAQLVYSELKFAVDFFKDWINNQIMTALPGSILYMDAIDEIETLDQQAKELTDKRRIKIQVLARLQSIKTNLETITSQPEPGSSEEKIIISLKKQYNATQNTISNTISVENARNELAVAKDKLANLNILLTRCTEERQEKGWSIPGGWDSTLSDSGTERELFCASPVKGGYDHGSFKHSNDYPNNPITYPEIPYVNAKKVLEYREDVRFGRDKTHIVNIELSCNIIFTTSLLEYKGNIPGITTVTNQYEELPPDTTPPPDRERGYCAYSDDLIYIDVETQEQCNAKGGSWVIPQE